MLNSFCLRILSGVVLKIFHSHLLMEHLVKKSSEDCFFFFFVKTETEGQSYGTSWRSVFPTVLEILFRVLWAFTAATDCHSGTLIMLHSWLGSTSWFLGEKVNIETYVFIPGGDWIVESGLWQQVDVRPMYCTTDELNEQPKERITCNAVLS